ncbi:zinc-ribbon domain-containing protein [Paenactinomyces guangxiensis]|uniref:Zinc-ribbon domain-containing protein n=1 Tax=Paenactinomyces guangxiensis TaxID=1490290 RepID=A0A7W2A7D4_9BACL|nr:zinc-ribbon domain-containing protein [Paenactinomyces guangxiensis]MBA4493430.1 zinc-ribbon domain-containing protein [Paenactinomyces guangxiensis]MBH8590521.1 zinc-ribbon domain-containing protein [Paenactinomyces guangxiensis]
MPNNKYETDDLGRLKQCAYCQEPNALEDDHEARHCIYCGYSLVNHCTNTNFCGKTVPPNAAYCPYCGTETHFLLSKLVEPKRKKNYIDEIPF